MRNSRREIAITERSGRPEQVIDGAGGVLWQATYDAYGAVEISAADIEMPLRYPGQYDDGAGWGWYNWNRTYIPELGNYAGIDPLFQHSGALYGYAGANPMWYVDPWGLSDIADKAQCYYDMAGGDWEKAQALVMADRYKAEKEGRLDYELAWIDHYIWSRNWRNDGHIIAEFAVIIPGWSGLKEIILRILPDPTTTLPTLSEQIYAWEGVLDADIEKYKNLF